jgi:hypothetical protein
MGKTRLLVIGALAVVALAAATSPALAHGGGKPVRVSAAGSLRDLSLATPAFTDGAYAEVTAKVHKGSTHVTMRLEGLNPSVAGTTYGAHVHSGNCIENDGAAAGPHYNAGGGVNDHTEIWLDFVVDAHGRAKSEAHVEFVIPAGDASAVVIHALPTDATGAAGGRLACLPVPF